MFFIQTSEELRLAEDNAALEDRVRHLEDLKRKRDGIEEDYRCIKEQVKPSGPNKVLIKQARKY